MHKLQHRDTNESTFFPNVQILKRTLRLRIFFFYMCNQESEKKKPKQNATKCKTNRRKIKKKAREAYVLLQNKNKTQKKCVHLK